MSITFNWSKEKDVALLFLILTIPIIVFIISVTVFGQKYLFPSLYQYIPVSYRLIGSAYIPLFSMFVAPLLYIIERAIGALVLAVISWALLISCTIIANHFLKVKKYKMLFAIWIALILHYWIVFLIQYIFDPFKLG